MGDERVRLNLNVDKEIVEFLKKWAYVEQKPISRLFDDVFGKEIERFKNMSPEEYWEWRSEEDFKELMSDVEAQAAFHEAYLKDQEEVEYCKKHPDSERAKRRIELIKAYEKKLQKEIEDERVAEKQEQKRRKEFIKRWNETFPK